MTGLAHGEPAGRLLAVNATVQPVRNGPSPRCSRSRAARSSSGQTCSSSPNRRSKSSVRATASVGCSCRTSRAGSQAGGVQGGGGEGALREGAGAVPACARRSRGPFHGDRRHPDGPGNPADTRPLIRPWTGGPAGAGTPGSGRLSDPSPPPDAPEPNTLPPQSPRTPGPSRRT